MQINLTDMQTAGQSDRGEILERGGKLWTETAKRRKKMGMMSCMLFNMQCECAGGNENSNKEVEGNR